MCESFRENWRELGQPDWPSKEEDERKTVSGGGSTDMGNIRYAKLTFTAGGIVSSTILQPHSASYSPELQDRHQVWQSSSRFHGVHCQAAQPGDSADCREDCGDDLPRSAVVT